MKVDEICGCKANKIVDLIKCVVKNKFVKKYSFKKWGQIDA